MAEELEEKPISADAAEAPTLAAEPSAHQTPVEQPAPVPTPPNLEGELNTALADHIKHLSDDTTSLSNALVEAKTQLAASNVQAQGQAAVTQILANQLEKETRHLGNISKALSQPPKTENPVTKVGKNLLDLGYAVATFIAALQVGRGTFGRISSIKFPGTRIGGAALGIGAAVLTSIGLGFVKVFGVNAIKHITGQKDTPDPQDVIASETKQLLQSRAQFSQQEFPQAMTEIQQRMEQSLAAQVGSRGASNLEALEQERAAAPQSRMVH